MPIKKKSYKLNDFIGKAKGGYCMNEGGAVSDSTQTVSPKKDYYDTDITKTPVKAHKDYYETDISTTKIKAHKENKVHGGYIEGAGNGTSDSIPAKVKKGSFVVPADQAIFAEQLRQKYLDQDQKHANLNQKGGSPVNLSNGEHLFSPDEAKEVDGKMKEDGLGGIDNLAPKAKKKFNSKHFFNKKYKK